jgi:hypothetical protein
MASSIQRIGFMVGLLALVGVVPDRRRADQPSIPALMLRPAALSTYHSPSWFASA